MAGTILAFPRAQAPRPRLVPGAPVALVDRSVDCTETHVDAWNKVVAAIHRWHGAPSPRALGAVFCAMLDFQALTIPNADARADLAANLFARMTTQAAAYALEISET